MAQNSSSAVMQQRHEALDALDDFPTPPWATRAACELLKERWPDWLKGAEAREPCANRGHMVRPLREYFEEVWASDVHDYGAGFPVADYLFPGAMVAADWTFMNPPFNLAADFILKSFETPDWRGSAALVRTAFLEGVGRYGRLFRWRPPTLIAQFTERVVMVKGRLEPKGSTATSYCWLFWVGYVPPQPFAWIPPCRKRLERPGDYPDQPRTDGAVHERAGVGIL